MSLNYSKLENNITSIEVTVNGEIRDCGKITADKDFISKIEEKFGKNNIIIS